MYTSGMIQSESPMCLTGCLSADHTEMMRKFLPGPKILINLLKLLGFLGLELLPILDPNTVY